ncbi:citrate synthase [Kaistia geumhonensis]|uniref:citrate synthase (unknown stereospecificity) n=2 Tax=Kaistia geumhonensis TaxID=410839 RepID=A0ABU0MCP2_9HYPH|nr:citrate synthase [Kaistia geumhonensis]
MTMALTKDASVAGQGAQGSFARGLAGVVAAETVLSAVEGEAGRLIIRGRRVEDLAPHMRYEAVAAMLLDGFAPVEGDFAGAIGKARKAAFTRFQGRLSGAGAPKDPVEAMRLLLAGIGDGDPLASPAGLIAATAVAAAMAIRASRGLDAVTPDAGLPHALDLRRMVTGTLSDAAEARAFETYLVTVIDHGLNASTFTARVVASTEAGLSSAVIAALSALKGRLHGGAPGPVLDMLDEIGTADAAEGWLDGRVASGERIMGFGHRAYRVRDPRADVLRAAVATLGDRDGRLDLARAVEKAALEVLARRKSGRRLDVNVEFYTALLLERLGIPREGFTPIFAAGRVAGWIAHALEQQQGGGLIRPESRYIGPLPA